MQRSIRLLVGALALALAVCIPAFAQAVYTWKDDKGVTHYSDSPPPAGAKKKTVKTAADPVPSSTPAPKVTVAAAQGGPDPAAAAAAAEQQAKQRATACKQAQANLAVLNSQAGVAVDRDGDGKSDAVLDANQRAQETQAMQTVAAANCD
ncbi:DUF4124 domain containing protein [Lysobacter dokdonensis DS-58]|uniref:DUF4124 domain containing protein n=1 Tax=Lysobacter dokdonensis DS-58 TaxID=1300345 RepID=A0A0A2WKW3_9GAMM|nr:DUF4124 domain-containing protein [Lysobacter dokdonensis]KGQ20821.1 DUF4124 domain containing protein [Lysobacter dokdonensis DS-58]